MLPFRLKMHLLIVNRVRLRSHRVYPDRLWHSRHWKVTGNCITVNWILIEFHGKFQSELLHIKSGGIGSHSKVFERQNWFRKRITQIMGLKYSFYVKAASFCVNIFWRAYRSFVLDNVFSRYGQDCFWVRLTSKIFMPSSILACQKSFHQSFQDHYFQLFFEGLQVLPLFWNRVKLRPVAGLHKHEFVL